MKFRVRIAVAALVFASLTPTSNAAETPNFIVIMADDLGYGDVSCYGATEISTPNIDRLAAEGQRFTNGYASASTCTPTRYSFLTGTYAFRQNGMGIAPPNSPALIRPGTPTIASVLKSAGYRTAVIGKWHLGLGDTRPDWNGDLKPGPLEIGFDRCFLLPTTNDRVPQVYVENHRVLNLDPDDPLWVGDQQPADDHPTGLTHRETLQMDWSHGHNNTIHNGISRIGFYTGGHAARFRDQDLSDRWVAESKQWITQNQDEPFFLFFASHELHVPRVVHERFQGSSKLGPRGDAIVELDWCVGELMNMLDELNLSEKTMVVFCSDNGPVLDDGYVDGAIEKLGDHRPAGPYRGGKYNVYEGGTRTPMITRWKGTIPAGVSEQLVCTIDFAASFASLAGASMPQDGLRDSEDVSGALSGNKSSIGRSSLVQQDNGTNGTFGFREGKWKLIRHGTKTVSNVMLRLVPTPAERHELYNLTNDPNEQRNVIDLYPDIAARMKRSLDATIAAEPPNGR